MFLNMMGFPDPYGIGYPAQPQGIDSTPPVSDVVPIAGDSHPEPDDVGMLGGDGSYVGSYGSVHDNPAVPPAPSGGDVVTIAGDSPAPESDSIYQNIGDLTAPQPPPGSDGIYQAVDDVVGGIVDLDAPPSLYGPPPEVVGGLVAWVKSAPKWLIPALLAIVVAVIVAVVALGGSSKSTEPPPPASTPTATTPTTASTPTATTAPTTTASTTPAPPASSLVTLSLGLGQVEGTKLPIPVTVTAAPNAPGVEKVTLALTGPGRARELHDDGGAGEVRHAHVRRNRLRELDGSGRVRERHGGARGRQPEPGERRDPQVLTGGPEREAPARPPRSG